MWGKFKLRYLVSVCVFVDICKEYALRVVLSLLELKELPNLHVFRVSISFYVHTYDQRRFAFDEIERNGRWQTLNIEYSEVPCSSYP